MNFSVCPILLISCGVIETENWTEFTKSQVFLKHGQFATAAALYLCLATYSILQVLYFHDTAKMSRQQPSKRVMGRRPRYRVSLNS